jgi:peptidoglycan-associated lipoprotein
MKRSVCSYALIFAMALLVGATGCKRSPKGPTPIQGARTTVPNTSNQTPLVQPIPPGQGFGDSNPIRSTQQADVDPARNPTDLPGFRNFDGPQDRDTLKPYIVYFDLDRHNVRADQASKLEAVAAHLKSNANQNLILEGHCDERGTEEYNRALGERRALSLREYLGNLGVNLERVLTKSFGEDKPAIVGHTEDAWSKNRRGEFVLVSPKIN